MLTIPPGATLSHREVRNAAATKLPRRLRCRMDVCECHFLLIRILLIHAGGRLAADKCLDLDSSLYLYPKLSCQARWYPLRPIAITALPSAPRTPLPSIRRLSGFMSTLPENGCTSLPTKRHCQLLQSIEAPSLTGKRGSGRQGLPQANVSNTSASDLRRRQISTLRRACA